MNFWKLLLFLLALVVGGYLLFWVFGFLAGLLWYAVIIGVIALAGYGGYKLLLGGDDEEKPKLREKMPVGISEVDNFDRALEEYKRRSLKE